jgi:hypothetical protein
MYAALLGIFAAIGVMFAAIGVHDLIAYQRTREIGIRMVLGLNAHRSWPWSFAGACSLRR